MFSHDHTHRSADVVWWLLLTTAVALATLFASSRVAGQTVTSGDPAQEAAYIVSPWDGAFGAGEYVGAAPYVEPGSHVEPATIVCTVEAMMTFHVPAGYSGTILEILVEDGQMVRAGQPLFKVELASPPEVAR